MAKFSTKEEYDALYFAGVRYFGHGIGTGMSLPCPFCCEPDFMVSTVLESQATMEKGATCQGCGRSLKAVFTIDTDSHKQFEFVQTGGPDCDVPFLPPIRRVE